MRSRRRDPACDGRAAARGARNGALCFSFPVLKSLGGLIESTKRRHLSQEVVVGETDVPFSNKAQRIDLIHIFKLFTDNHRMYGLNRAKYLQLCNFLFSSPPPISSCFVDLILSFRRL